MRGARAGLHNHPFGPAMTEARSAQSGAFRSTRFSRADGGRRRGAVDRADAAFDAKLGECVAGSTPGTMRWEDAAAVQANKAAHIPAGSVAIDQAQDAGRDRPATDMHDNVTVAIL